MDAPAAVELVWHRGPGASACIDSPELAAKVQATLGRPVRSPAADPDETSTATVLHGEVSPLPSGWIAIVDVRNGDSASLRREVTLDAPDCRQLDEAIVLVVALMADAASPRAPRLNLPVRVPSVTVAIGPDLEVVSGMLPGVTPGFGLASDVALPPFWHVSIWGHAWPTSEALEGPSGGRLAAWTFGVGPCVGPLDARRFAFAACAGVSGGVIYSSGVGLEVSHSHDRPYLQGELRIGARLRLAGPAFARLEIGAALPVARDSYQYTAPDGTSHEVFRTALAVPLARLAIEFRAP